MYYIVGFVFSIFIKFESNLFKFIVQLNKANEIKLIRQKYKLKYRCDL